MLYIKQYDTYQDYINFQLLKSNDPRRIKMWRRDKEKRTKKFVRRFRDIKLPLGSKIICLGARLGDEVDAWTILGYQAIGIDIAPHDHPRVYKGDFHDIKYPDGTFNCVYSNSLDHSNDIDKFISESLRILKPDGLLILDIMLNQDGMFEVVHLDGVDDLRKIVEQYNVTFLGEGYKRARKNAGLYPKAKEHQLIWRKK